MAARKVSHLQETKKSDQQQLKAPEIPGDYYLDREQLDAIRHLVLAAQGIAHEFSEQDELEAVAEIFQGLSNGISSVMQQIESQRIPEGGAA
jgi:hypothetical protein